MAASFLQLDFRWIAILGMSSMLIAPGAVASIAPDESLTPSTTPASQPSSTSPVEVPPGTAAPEHEAKPSEPAEPVDSDAPSARSAREGDEIKVIFKDGRQVEGFFISETPTTVVVKIAAISVTLERSTIDRIVVLPPAEERFRQMRALVKTGDTERLLSLAEWARRHQLYDRAMDVVDEVLRDEPTSAEAQRLKKLLGELISLKRRAPAPPAPSAPPPTASTPTEFDRPASPPRSRAVDFPLLTPDQINLIKVYELDLARLPRLMIPRQTVEKLLAKYADHPLIPTTREGREAFLAAPESTILDVMFRVRAKEFYGQVQVLGQPRSMEFFRDKIHAGWLINNCATSRCHGGPEGGRLMLTNRRPNSDASLYTNFLILDRFRTRDGRPLINADNPASSLLLQMGLPRDDAAFPHPPARGWTPIFSSRDARRYQETVEWIGMLYRPRPDYPIEYTPPGEALRPAPAPAANEGAPR